MRSNSLVLSPVFFLLVTGCGTGLSYSGDAGAQSAFQDSVDAAGITPPALGIDFFAGGKVLISAQSTKDTTNVNQELGWRGTDTDRNWVWDESNLTAIPYIVNDEAVAWGSTLGWGNTYLMNIASDDAVPGVDDGWGSGIEDSENWGWVFEAQECGRIIYDACVHIKNDGTPVEADCSDLYVAPDPCPNGYVDPDTGNTGS